MKLYKDILDLKTWIREEEGAKAEGKGQFGKIHSEKQLMDLIYKFNKDKKKEMNIIWFNQGVDIKEGKVLASAKVVITNGEESIEELMVGLGEEKRSDISFGLGKALTYGKRFWLQKFLDLSSDDIDPEHVSNKVVENKTQTKTFVAPATSTQKDPNELAINSKGYNCTTSDKVKLTNGEVSKVARSNQKYWELTKAQVDAIV